MPKPSGTIRPIQYPLNRADNLILDTPNNPHIPLESLDNWTTNDPDERVLIAMELSLNEYVALATCIDVGRDIAYGDESLYIWWLWVRGIISMDLCQLILQCINDTEAIQQAIANYSIQSSIVQNTPENAIALATPFIDTPPSCDNDNIFGMVSQLVDFTNAINEDILELFVNAPFALARLGDLIEAIPGIGELPVDDIFQFVESFLEDVNDAYQASYTVSLANEFKCDLFCLAVNNNCYLDLADVRNYFRNRLSVTLDTTDFLAWVNDVLANNWLGTATVEIMFTMFFQVLAFGGEILGQNAHKVGRIVQSMFNDPNPDWSILCDDCNPSWSHTYDFTQSQHGWTILVTTAPRGKYTAGVGFEPTLTVEGSTRNYTIDIRKTIPANSAVIETITMAGEIVVGQQQTPVNEIRYIWGSSNVEAVLTNGTFNHTEQITTNNVGVTSLGLTLRVSNRQNATPNPLGSGKVTSVTFTGSGTNPFV